MNQSSQKPWSETLETSYNKASLFCIFSPCPRVFCFTSCKMTHLQKKSVIPGLVVGTSTNAYCTFSRTRIKNLQNKQCLKFSLLLSGQKLQYINAKRPLFPMVSNSAQKIFGSGNCSSWKQLIGIESCIQTCPCALCFQLALLVSNPSEQPHAFFIVWEASRFLREPTCSAEAPNPHTACAKGSVIQWTLLWCNYP